jgi:hypothetical protein
MPGWLEKYKYKRYMAKEERMNMEIAQAAKDEKRYNALAKAESAKANLEQTRTRTYKAQAARSSGGGGVGGKVERFVGGLAGASQAAGNALLGDIGFGAPTQTRSRPRKQTQKYVIVEPSRPKKRKKQSRQPKSPDVYNMF